MWELPAVSQAMGARAQPLELAQLKPEADLCPSPLSQRAGKSNSKRSSADLTHTGCAVILTS